MAFPGYQSPPPPPPSLLDLHPVEAMLALLLISAAALLRLVADPPRPLWQQQVPYSSAAIAIRAIWENEPPGSGIISPEKFEDARRTFAAICPTAATAKEWADTHIR